MKKLTLLLLTGYIITFASCSSSNDSQNAAQAQIDSMVTVKTGQIQASMQAKNDSIINALAKAKADSIIAAAKNVVIRTDTNRNKGYTRGIDTQNVIQKPVVPLQPAMHQGK